MVTAELRNLLSALGERAAREITQRIGGLTGNLTSLASNEGTPGGSALSAGLGQLASGKSPCERRSARPPPESRSASRTLSGSNGMADLASHRPEAGPNQGPAEEAGR
ncbi:hypothetical protein [Phytohabitans houttuyneae]|nr:hypothetical protein [Phytohabitans houttuyneae]